MASRDIITAMYVIHGLCEIPAISRLLELIGASLIQIKKFHFSVCQFQYVMVI